MNETKRRSFSLKPILNYTHRACSSSVSPATDSQDWLDHCRRRVNPNSMTEVEVLKLSASRRRREGGRERNREREKGGERKREGEQGKERYADRESLSLD